MSLGATQAAHRRFWQWLKAQIVRPVPEPYGLCEFDCRKQQCAGDELENCERRIRRASGELWPKSSSAHRGDPSPLVDPSPTNPISKEVEGVEKSAASPVSQSAGSLVPKSLGPR